MIYGNIETNIITQRNELDESMKKKIPEGAIYFEGIVSNGDKNRNGYIIDSDAWFFNKGKYVKNFLKSGSVLYSHDPDKPIGRPLTFEKLDNGDIKVTGYVFDDIHTNGAIGRGIILGLSTGHITHASLYRNNKTGEEMSVKEFYSKLWDDEKTYNEYVEGYWDWVVTQAEIVEYSFVTTPSNRKSTINGVDEELIKDMSKHLNKTSQEVENLFLKKNNMGRTETGEEEGVDVSENKVEVLTNENTTLKTEMETLKNEISEKTQEIETLKNAFQEKETEINTLKEELSKKETEINTLRKDEEKRVLAEVNNGIGTTTDKTEKNEVKSMEDLMKKHR